MGAAADAAWAAARAAADAGAAADAAGAAADAAGAAADAAWAAAWAKYQKWINDRLVAEVEKGKEKSVSLPSIPCPYAELGE